MTTFRRYVEYSHDGPLAGLVSTPWWKQIPGDQVTRCRHFICSGRFAKEFPGVHPNQLLEFVNRSTRPRKSEGPGEFTIQLEDACGYRRTFHAEAFFNQHYLMTLFVEQK